MARNTKDKGTSKPKGPKGRRRTVPAEISHARKALAWELRVMNGLTFREITIHLNEAFPAYPLKSDHQAVMKMVKEAEREYVAEKKAAVEDIKAEIGMTMDWIRAEAAKAWEKSKGVIRIIKHKAGKPIEQTAKEDPGDSAYLSKIIDAAKLKADIFGAHAPRKIEHAGPEGGPIPLLEFDMEAWKKERSRRLKVAKGLEE